MNKKLIDRIKEIFFKKLMSNTTHGRNQIMALYNESITEAIMELAKLD